jgi:hypothetical protein
MRLMEEQGYLNREINELKEKKDDI